jgi:hypothetical protein
MTTISIRIADYRRAFICILSICVFLCCALPAPGQEIVSTPAVPSGPASGVSGTLYQYTAGGSTDSLGNPVQYSFTWGDGSVNFKAKPAQ